MLEYGLNIDQIKENVESSYGELILWNACKIATMRNVPMHIIERSGEIITESNWSIIVSWGQSSVFQN